MEELIYKYFPNLTQEQKSKISRLYPLYAEWNEKINLISRKDVGNFYLRHVLHSLAIAKNINFPQGTTILDVGTGGGFPGIPLAIIFPHSEFTLCDSIAKKILAVSSVAQSLSLNNVTTVNDRVEKIAGRFDFVVSRAVANLAQFLPLVWNRLNTGKIEHLSRGIFYLKGGELNEEMVAGAKRMNIKMENFSKTEISQWFSEPWFEDKSIVFIKR